MKKFILSMVLLLACGNAGASFMEENDLYLEDNHYLSNMTEDQFDNVVNRIQKYLGPVSENTGMPLKILGHWEDSTVNAYAYVRNGVRYVEIFGGLARRPEVTRDALALVLCHEVGHHLGGFPKYDGQWAADEGQSDYYSTLACSRLIWGNQKKQNKKAKREIPKYPRKQCNSVWFWNSERDLCYRSMLAGKSLADLLSRSGDVDYSTKDDNLVEETQHSHPDAQCRLDTYMAGALCTARWNHTMIPETENDAYSVSCSMDEYVFGWRPRCWFKPEEK